MESVGRPIPTERTSSSPPYPKVLLCPLQREHLEAFWTWASDPEVTQFLMWDTYTSKKEAEDFLVQVAEKHPWFMAISYQGQVVGSITLEQGKGAHSCKAELGYVIAKKHWGKGFATSAIIRALSVGFKELKVKRIEAYVEPTHAASWRALEKGGLVREALLQRAIVHKGVVKDRYLYSKVID